MSKYLLCYPQGGFTDQLSVMMRCYKYCQRYNRTLLINTTKSSYGINLSDYLNFKTPDEDINIICDINIIENILNNNILSIYPKFDKSILTTMNMYYTIDGYKTSDTHKLIVAPLDRNYTEDIILYAHCRIHDDYPIEMFNIMKLEKVVIDEFENRLSKIPKPYTSIQVRNTDYQCDFKKLYNDNKEKIHNISNLFIATDHPHVLQFFQSKRDVYNFTTFPTEVQLKTCPNLHYNIGIPSKTRILDTLCDLFIISHSQELLSVSIGSYIRLARGLFHNKKIIYNLIKNK